MSQPGDNRPPKKHSDPKKIKSRKGKKPGEEKAETEDIASVSKPKSSSSSSSSSSSLLNQHVQTLLSRYLEKYQLDQPLFSSDDENEPQQRLVWSGSVQLHISVPLLSPVEPSTLSAPHELGQLQAGIKPIPPISSAQYEQGQFQAGIEEILPTSLAQYEQGQLPAGTKPIPPTSSTQYGQGQLQAGTKPIHLTSPAQYEQGQLQAGMKPIPPISSAPYEQDIVTPEKKPPRYTESPSTTSPSRSSPYFLRSRGSTPIDENTQTISQLPTEVTSLLTDLSPEPSSNGESPAQTEEIAYYSPSPMSISDTLHYDPEHIRGSLSITHEQMCEIVNSLCEMNRIKNELKAIKSSQYAKPHQPSQYEEAREFNLYAEAPQFVQYAEAPQLGQYAEAPHPGQYAEATQPGQYAEAPQSGQYAEAPQPDQYADAPQPGQYAEAPQPGQFTETSQPSQYAEASKTSQFAGASKPIQYTPASKPAGQHEQAGKPMQYMEELAISHFGRLLDRDFPCRLQPQLQPGPLAEEQPTSSRRLRSATWNPSPFPPQTICPVCEMRFVDAAKCNYHCYTEHKNKKLLECSVCLWKFKTRLALDLHTKEKHPPRGSECPVCKEICPTRDILQKHKNFHESARRFCRRCPDCQHPFMTDDGLVNHYLEKHKKGIPESYWSKLARVKQVEWEEVKKKKEEEETKKKRKKEDEDEEEDVAKKR